MRVSRIILAAFLFICINTKAQEVVFDTLEFKTINRLLRSSDPIIDNESIPEKLNSAGGVIEFPHLMIDTSWWGERDTEWKIFMFEKVKKWKLDHNIKDDGESGFYYGIVSKDNNYYVKKMTGIVKYLVREIGGGSQVVRIVDIQENKFDEILCLFNKEVKLTEKKIGLNFIMPRAKKYPNNSVNPNGYVFDKNIRISYPFQNTTYSFEQRASLSNYQSKYKTIDVDFSQYFNVSLKIRNESTGIEQIVLKTPMDDNYNLSEIILGDIDSDGELDLIYSLIGQSCKNRLFFLSSFKEDEALFKYMGVRRLNCVYP